MSLAVPPRIISTPFSISISLERSSLEIPLVWPAFHHLCGLHVAIFEESLEAHEAPDTPEGHPIHTFTRENQLFPFLEKRGVTGPSQVMWSICDDIRGQLNRVFRRARQGAALSRVPRGFSGRHGNQKTRGAATAARLAVSRSDWSGQQRFLVRKESTVPIILCISSYRSLGAARISSSLCRYLPGTSS